MGEFGVVFQNEPVDVSEEFSKQENHFFVGDRVEEFDPESASGKICWRSLALKQRVSYHQITGQFEDYKTWEDLPPGEYCLLYTSPSPRDRQKSRMPSSA